MLSGLGRTAVADQQPTQLGHIELDGLSPETDSRGENDNMTLRFCLILLQEAAIVLLVTLPSSADEPYRHAAPKVTSLTNPDVKYQSTKEHYVVLSRGKVSATIVDNAAIDVPQLPGHRSGYNGLASLTHRNRPQNLFVPAVGGLNFEHIHDGTVEGLIEKFEPRRFPMELRIIDEHTVEVYQPPTGNWKLESCGRYQMLPDGTIEYTFECIPRTAGYRNGYIGLFWANYIHQPDDKAIHFIGRPAKSNEEPTWIKGITPKHGVNSTHPPANTRDRINVDDDFPLTLVNHPSKYVYTQPWYFAVSHGMAYAMMFRQSDDIWLAQSPSGGGNGNPAWDFQWFIPEYKVGRAYGFTMRAAYFPFVNRAQVEREAKRHLKAMGNR